jgi:Big-like domain-containing protein
MHVRRIVFAQIVLAGVVTACSSSSDGTGPTPNPIATIAITANDSSITVGATAQLTAVARDSAGATIGSAHISFSSSSSAIATVSASGAVTGAGAGSAWLSAVAGAVKDSVAIVVSDTVVPVPDTVPAANVVRVGPTRTYKTPCAAIAVAQANDVIEIDAATYSGDVCVISTAGLTLRGVGGRPKLDAAGHSAEGKAIWVIRNPNTTIENIEFANATVTDNNGAGIRHESGNLTIRHCYFDHNQDGILTGADSTSDVVIEFSEFAFSGNTPTPGQEHNMYIGAIHSFTLRGSYSHDVTEGNLVKSRARTNYILYNRITGEGGTDSYELDLPNGGRSYVIGNIIEQGASSPNHTIIEYGAEGIPAGRATDLFVVNNTIVNDASAGTFVYVNGAVTTPVTLRNNIFSGPGTITTQASAVLDANTTAADGDPKFVNRSAYDYRLLAGSPAIDHGSAPGSGFGVSLTPTLQYVHPMSTVPRATAGTAIDRGAYELVP